MATTQAQPTARNNKNNTNPLPVLRPPSLRPGRSRDRHSASCTLGRAPMPTTTRSPDIIAPPFSLTHRRRPRLPSPRGERRRHALRAVRGCQLTTSRNASRFVLLQAREVLQLEIDFRKKAGGRASLTVCKNLEPPSCFWRAKVLGLLIPASCLFHVRAHPYHTELCEHSGIVGRA
jgi:hypothetical protein